MKPLRPFVALTVLALVAAACGGGGSGEASTTTSSSSTTSTTVKATTTSSSTSTTSTTLPPTIRQPLTGEPLESADQIVQRAALVAKIDNNGAAVPNHSGLAVADIVFEEVVEGRTTRFAAVFHSQSSDPIGPIRSGRTQDIDLFTSFFFPLFVWSGGNPGVTRAINESTLINMGPNTARGFYRGPGRAPHNLYNATDVIWEQAPGDEPVLPRQQFVYLESDEAFDGDATAGVTARIGSENIEWTWNAEFSKFDRSQRGRAHEDKLFGRIRATNVIVMGVEYRPSRVDRNSPEAQSVGSGPVWVFSDGKVTTGSWIREVNTEPLSFVTADGAAIALTPGNTWIELADLDDVAAGRIVVLPPTPPAP
ncbi:MAG TPA: DUF3048 domain-containing protein [Ilumatobacteraceae bacterium]|nr:DUF3048 domain-containing protein [Ilumatobacteraceae bacterium]